MEKPVSVLVVDDSAMMRNLIRRMLERAPDISVAGIAMNGDFALKKIDKLDIDCITLDLEMPVMNGIEFLKERRKRKIDIPVIILSSIAKKGAKVTMEALGLGASDFVLKPAGSNTQNLETISGDLISLVQIYGKRYQKRKHGYPEVPPQTVKTESRSIPAVSRPKKLTAVRTPGKVEIIAIGISTGGPNALREVFPYINAELPVPFLIVQHMPAGFTTEFAESLNKITPLEVREAKDGDLLKNGRVLIAPGNWHMTVEDKPLARVVRLSDDLAVNGHRPSVGVLFTSVAEVYKNNCLAIIMTGMGRDGAKGICRIYREGGMTLAQDEKSCVVFGMPRAAIEMGGIHRVVPLGAIAETINSLVLS